MAGLRQGALCGVVTFAFAAGLSSTVLAASEMDYSDKDFGVRLPAAFIRFTEVSTMGGETAANRWSSAINPAATDWEELPGKLGLVFAPYYSIIAFQEGTVLHLTGESVTWDTRTWGTFQPTVTQIHSSRAETRQGLGFDYDVDSFQLQWGKRFGDFALGANFNLSLAKVVERKGPFKVVDADAQSYRFRFGGLYEPVEHLLAGLVFEYGFAPAQTDVLTFTRYGPMKARVYRTEQQFILRPGVSYEYADRSTVYLDYQFGVFATEDDILHSHRFSTGVQHCLLQFIYLRAGPSVDLRGNVGLDAGIGIYPAKWIGLDFGYHFNTLPEMQPEFGRSHTFQIAVSVRV